MKNKKAEISIVIIVIVAIVGILVAGKLGLFSIFTPSVGQPAGTDSLVNPVYYDATNLGPAACQKSYTVYFRTTDNTYAAGTGIAYTRTPGTALTAYGKTTGACTTKYCDQTDYLALVPTSTGTTKLFMDGSDVCICEPGVVTHSYSKRYTTADSDAALVSTSTSPIDSPKELATVADIKDAGIFACSNGNVVKQYCGSFGSSLIEDCTSTQSCTYKADYQTPDGIKPAVKCSGNYKPSQKLCVGTTLYSTNADGSSISSQVCGYTCSNNVCIDCQDGLKRCKQLSSTTSDIEICSAGKWIQWNDATATCIGDQQCIFGVCTSDATPGMKQCNGKQPQVYTSSYLWVNDGEACDIQCNEVSATEVTCTKECETAGYYCAAGELYNCLTTDRDNEKSRIGTCASGYCTSDNKKCAATKTLGLRYCSGNDIYKAVSSGNDYDLFGGVIGQKQETCANTCIPAGTNDATCSKIAGCEGKSGLSICLNSFERATCSLNEQSYTAQENCINTYAGGFCEIKDNVGVCSKPASQCEGAVLCSNGIIRACTDGNIGSEIFNCNDLGCQTLSSGLPVCADGCTTLDKYECKNQDSYVCAYDTSTPTSVSQQQKLLKLSMDCSSEGCDSSTGRCIQSGTPNTYTCMGEDRTGDGLGDDIWYINSNGQLDSLKSQCGAGAASYCSAGISYCKFCEQSYISCSSDNKQEIRCIDDKTGEREVLDNCEVSCFVRNSIRYCDDLNAIISESQNFLADESVSIKGLLKGSESGDGIAVSSISVTLSGAGETRTLSGASGSSGNFDVNFGTKAIGKYNATISVLGKEYNVNVKVTNDFIIKLYGSQVLTSIPGTTPSTELEVVGGTGEPDDIIELETPQGIESIELTKASVTGRWNLIVKGEPGIYQLKLAAVDNGVTLDPYTISIELRKPSLQITNNIPDSSTPGTKEYEIKVQAPQMISGNLKTDQIQPDSISVTINGAAYSLTPGSLGNGRYLVNYNFAAGTYTINIDAAKSGYEPVSVSKQIQISTSGTDLPPSSSTGGTNQTTTTGTTGTSSGTLDAKAILILLVIGVVAYFVFVKKK